MPSALAGNSAGAGFAGRRLVERPAGLLWQPALALAAAER
jgi:hypothetical protein